MKLKNYQLLGIKFLKTARRALVVLPTGAGKTFIGMKASEDILASGGTLLVLCPLSLVSQWQDNVKGLMPRARVVSFSQLHKQLDLIKRVKPKITIVDEPKPLKSITNVFQLITQIKSPYRFILDATPIENSLQECWFLFRWLKPELFGSLENFNNNFVTRSGVYKNMDKFRSLVGKHIYQPKVAQTRGRVLKFVQVEPIFDLENQLEYDELRDTLRNSLKYSHKHPQALLRAMGKISKLRSFLGDVNKGGKAKVNKLVDFLLENPDRRGVIFCYKRDTVKEVVRRLRDEDICAEPFMGDTSAARRGELGKEFNQGKIRCLVATSAGERGIDLPTGNLIVHFDLPWTRAAYDQRDRVSRLSSDQADHTLIMTLILRNTVEVLIWSIIAAKHELMVKPFDNNVTDLVIKRDSWSKFLNTFIGGIGSGKINEETGEGIWFSRG